MRASRRGKPGNKVSSRIRKSAPKAEAPKAEAPKAEAPKADKPKTSSFGSAFSSARKAGDKEFTWNGKKYHTRTKEEEDAAKKTKAAPKSYTETAKAKQAGAMKRKNDQMAKMQADAQTKKGDPKNVAKLKPSEKTKKGKG